MEAQRVTALLVATALLPAALFAESYPRAAEHPVVDGAFSSPLEYTNANVVRDEYDVGDFYKQHIEDWTVGGITYTGTISFFDTHVFTDAAYGQLDAYDLNSFEFVWGGNRVSTWVFLPGDNTPDEWWLQAVGLSGYTALNDDGGFLVRLNNDPSTDRIWTPGDVQPGDPGWNFANYYGVFAGGGFNNSAHVHGYNTTVTDDREIYEWSITMNHVGGGVPGAGGDNPDAPGVCDPIWELQTKERLVMDWKPEMGGHGTWGGPGWIPYQEWVLMGWDDSMHPTPVPTACLLGALGLGTSMLRLRRRNRSCVRRT